MNLHEIPAVAQNYSIKLTCCVPQPVMMLCTITKPESLKIRRKNIFKNSYFSFLLLLFFFFRMARSSGNLVVATELLIVRSGRVSSNVGS